MVMPIIFIWHTRTYREVMEVVDGLFVVDGWDMLCDVAAAAAPNRQRLWLMSLQIVSSHWVSHRPSERQVVAFSFFEIVVAFVVFRFTWYRSLLRSSARNKNFPSVLKYVCKFVFVLKFGKHFCEFYCLLFMKRRGLNVWIFTLVIVK